MDNVQETQVMSPSQHGGNADTLQGESAEATAEMQQQEQGALEQSCEEDGEGGDGDASPSLGMYKGVRRSINRRPKKKVMVISPGAKRKSGLMQAVENQVAEVLQGLFGGKVASQGSSSGDAAQGGSTSSPFSLVSGGSGSGVVQNLQSAFDLTVGDTLGGTHQQKRKQDDGWDWWHQGGDTSKSQKDGQWRNGIPPEPEDDAEQWPWRGVNKDSSWWHGDGWQSQEADNGSWWQEEAAPSAATQQEADLSALCNQMRQMRELLVESTMTNLTLASAGKTASSSVDSLVETVKGTVQVPALPKPGDDVSCMAFGDWLERVRPIITGMSTTAGVWWARVEEMARLCYGEYCKADTLTRLDVQPTLDAVIVDGRYTQVSAKTTEVLLGAISEELAN
jgi:hypothetical protein